MKNPCLECIYKGKDCDGARDGGTAAENYLFGCGPYARYLGYQECLKDMAEKCGPKPCSDCPFVHHQPECLKSCADLHEWLGQQEGYAKGLLEAESKKGGHHSVVHGVSLGVPVGY